MIYLKRFSAVTIKVKIGTLLGTEWVLSIANWQQLSQRIAEQFFRIGGKVEQLELTQLQETQVIQVQLFTQGLILLSNPI